VLGALSLPRRRATAWLGIVLAVLALVSLRSRDVRAKNARVTRAAIDRTRAAIDAYRAEHDGVCPRDLAELTTPRDRPPYLSAVPRDAWSRPLRYQCPSRDASRAYDLVSDGPDGEPWGLDRIE
jgi:type II secretory pathway pseudopilin PulG